tara:strand:+ start:490 stop:1185 length:696 start_codon:yes stop_codon:yes gene_type:complete
MAYRDNKAYDFRLVKHMAHSALTIDLGKEFSGTVTAFMKTSYSEDHYRELTVTGGRYISLTQDQTVDLVDNGVTYPIEGRWYINVWQVGEGDDNNEKQIIYTGKILFIGQVDDYAGTDGGTPVDEDLYFFQFSGVTYDINDINLINADFLALYGQEFATSELESGQTITLGNLGRYGFYIETATNPPIKIYNELSVEITDSFDYVYQGGVAYYVSQEFSVPANIYFKIETT